MRVGDLRNDSAGGCLSKLSFDAVGLRTGSISVEQLRIELPALLVELHSQRESTSRPNRCGILETGRVVGTGQSQSIDRCTQGECDGTTTTRCDGDVVLVVRRRNSTYTFR